MDLFWGYRLTRDGKVLNPDGTPRKLYKDPAGYWKVSLQNPNTGEHKQKYIQRLLGLNFIENPCPGVFIMVDHIDRRKGNNELSNLRWLTHRLNCINNDAENVSFRRKWGKWQAKVTGRDRPPVQFRRKGAIRVYGCQGQKGAPPLPVQPGRA